MSATGLYAPNGDFISFSSVRTSQLSGEFATTAKALGYDPASWLGLMPDPDPVLRKRGDDASVLEELQGDDEISTALEKRILRTQNKGSYSYNPGHGEGEEPGELAVTACKMLERDLAKLPLRDLFGEILETPFFGPTFSELFWQREDGRLRLKDIITKPRNWFGFDEQRMPIFMSTLATEGELLPTNKFLMTRHRPSFSNPYGVRLLTRCLWPVAFKRGGIEFWSRFCEKFGSAFMVAKAGKDERERAVIANQLVSMIQDAVAVVPSGSEVDLVQASGKSGDLHKSYVSFWNKSISKVLTGQTLSTDQDGQGSRAASETHSEQLDALAESDEAMLVATMNQLGRAYTRVNFGTEVLPPVFSFSEPEDLKEKLEIDKGLADLGVKFKSAHICNSYGIPEDEFYMAESSPDRVPSQGQESAEFAAHSVDSKSGDYQTAIDNFADSLITEAVKLNGDFVTQIEKIVKQAESVEDLQIMLAELLGQSANQDELEELLSNAMINVAMAGRAESHKEAGDD